MALDAERLHHQPQPFLQQPRRVRALQCQARQLGTAIFQRGVESIDMCCEPRLDADSRSGGGHQQQLVGTEPERNHVVKDAPLLIEDLAIAALTRRQPR